MRQLNDVGLTPDQQEALAELRRGESAEFEVEAMAPFGSATREEADEESDLDLLILTKKPPPRPTRHRITDLIFDLNLRYRPILSFLVIDRENWESDAVSVLPTHDEILRDGEPYEESHQNRHILPYRSQHVAEKRKISSRH